MDKYLFNNEIPKIGYNAFITIHFCKYLLTYPPQLNKPMSHLYALCVPVIPHNLLRCCDVYTYLLLFLVFVMILQAVFLKRNVSALYLYTMHHIVDVLW